MRDDFTEPTKRALAHRVGFKCSNPDCRKPTSGPSTEDESKHISIGVAAHICAASEGGPRYDSSMSSEERAAMKNGIWLCQSCSKLIDSDVVRYTVTLLSAWKNAAEGIALAELSTNTTIASYSDDKALIQFYLQCFDRPAFQHPIEQEGHMEDFEQAIEDTIIAINTGVLRTRDGNMLKTAEGKSAVANIAWRRKMDTIADMLISIKHRLYVAKADKIYWSSEYGSYCFNDRAIAEWFDYTRCEIIKLLSSICEEAGINNSMVFPRHRRSW